MKKIVIKKSLKEIKSKKRIISTDDLLNVILDIKDLMVKKFEDIENRFATKEDLAEMSRDLQVVIEINNANLVSLLKDERSVNSVKYNVLEKRVSILEKAVY
jgi:hypothetical protein